MSIRFLSLRAKHFLLITGLVFGLCGCLFIVSQAAAQAGAPLDVGLNQAAETGLSQTDIRIVIARIIRAALGLLGIVALGLVLYGGYMYMTAGGNEDRITQAKRILMNAGVGLIIIMSAFGIVSFVMSRLVDATNGGSGETVGLDGNLNEEIDDGSGGFSRAFYVVALPQGGEICVANVNPQIVFNKEVNLATVQTAIVVANKTNNQVAPGSWRYGTDRSSVVFVPTGSCGADASAGNDCFTPNTEFTITFTNPTDIKTLSTDPEQSLNCRYRAGCNQVTFKSGEAVDRLPPVVTITAPTADTEISAGSVVPVRVTYSDDNGVQGITVLNNNQVQDSVSFVGCKKSDTVTLDWPVGASLTGQQIITVRAADWAGHEGSDTQNVSIKPAHCANGVLETNLGEERLGPPECGGACGACSGGSCSANNQCASGSCVNGVCTNVMKIDGFSPASGGVGTLVSISGKYFGTTPGKVFFANKENPNVATAGDWVEAAVANCGAAVSPWSPNQILVQVPTGVANFSHIKVQTAGTNPAIDSTKNHAELRAFEVNNVVRPRLCSVSPTNGTSGAAVTLTGEQFGELTTANDKVVFGNLNALIVRAANNSFSWVDNRIVATVPGIEQGAVGVKVIKNNVESNSVRFFVDSGVTSDAPVISELSPGRGAEGEYITITGDNFGDKLGAVWFKEAANSPAILGDFVFPAECNGFVWSDNKIVVKFPKGKGVVGKTYYVQVNTTNNKTSNLSQSKTFALEGGTPKPGICKISPTSGPIPFPTGQSVTLAGEYFVSAEGTPGQVFFWNTGATSPETTSGRVAVPAENVVSMSANTAVVVPPENTVTGPVSVFRANDQEISNPAQFGVFDCRDEANECSAEQHCCLNGNEAGVCKPIGEFCSGEVLSAGYVWRFATQDIPPVPHVLERCDDEVDAGRALPSPSPSTAWDRDLAGPHHNVCRRALITVEFTSVLDAATVNNNTVKVTKCSAITNGTCFDAEPVAFNYELRDAFSSNQEERQYLEVTPNQTWDDDSWYQVVLTNKIKSPGLNGRPGVALAADKACGGDSAYCFSFKSGNTDCRLKTVVVTPYSYVAKVLEAPMSRRFGDNSFPVDYRGLGLADQRCVVMDTRSLNWRWSTDNTDYATIHGVGTRQVENIDTLANTVGVGLTDDAVLVKAQGSVETGDGEISKEGQSPLTIDLSNPAIMEYWPNCLEVCTNAEVGLRFNVSMSTRNLATGVTLLKCQDENCFETTEVSSPSSITMPDEQGGTVIKLANNSSGASELEPNSLYQVVVSVTSTNPVASQEMLWARSKSSDPSSYGKPFNKQFTWRFRTKKEKCQISRAEVSPKQYIARLVNDKSIFTVQPYSAPDSCSARGQKLNAWEVSWAWQSSDTRVAELTSFSTKGRSPYCTGSCVVKGSAVPASSGQLAPICGNARVEPGEDCDEPGLSRGCSLDCRWIGKSATSQCGNGTVEVGEACDPGDERTKIGCSSACQHLGSSPKTASQDVNASICGNGLLGSGEDCDLGIGDQGSNRSSQNCSAICLHTGTRLSTKWCLDHDRDLAGFSHEAFKAACARAYSQCGDGVQNPDEDAGCDLGGGKYASWCNASCVINSADKPECTPGAEGCTAQGQHAGASLAYSTPSICGDGRTGIGEDGYCEQTAVATRASGLFDPWALVRAVGLGTSSGRPPAQKSEISAVTSQNTSQNSIRGSGEFVIKCGYKTDADCKAAMGSDTYGVGDDTCCYARAKLLSTYPADHANNVCRNTTISATFKGHIRESSLPGNVLIARGIRSGNCAASTTDITGLLALQQPVTPSGSWYQRAWSSVTNFFRGLFGNEALALPNDITKWCAGLDMGQADVSVDSFNTSTSHIVVHLAEPLAGDTDYAIVLKKEVKDTAGVRIANDEFIWSFITAGKICEVDAVTVDPSAWYFSKAGATTTLTATAHTNGPEGDSIQPVNGYSWEYNWQPQSNPSVVIQSVTSTTNTIEAKNVQGEATVRATALVTQNKYTTKTGVLGYGTSRITVALCENPWPPKDVTLSSGRITVLPYEDVVDNNDAFDVSAKVFTGGTIPAGSGYFNFSTFYCADAGSAGTFDDLPYLHPAVQSDPELLKAAVGSCEISGDTCQADTDCGTQYTTAQGSITLTGSNDRVCGLVADQTRPAEYFFNSSGEAVSCTSAGMCNNTEITAWASAKQRTFDCLQLPATRKDLKCFKNSALKRFIFTPVEGTVANGDAIGIQIFANPRHLPVEEWYRQDKSRGGQGFVGDLQKLTIAGYEAVSDGSNIYVDALNYSNQKIFSNIYLFSVNANAKPTTRNVFEQLMKNLVLNRNIEHNEGYCGPSIDEPEFEKQCTSDLDCEAGDVCAVQVDKLKRDYRRLLDLKKIDDLLVTYANSNGGKFPSVASGSFLPGQSLSVWDWAGLTSVLGKGLPKDPINILGKAGTCTKQPSTYCTKDADCGTNDTCTLHDSMTGWSTANKRFSFACAPNSYAYRYKFTTTTGFTVMTNMEEVGLDLDSSSLNAFIRGFNFSNNQRFKGIFADGDNAGICDVANEISSISQGTCGDGVVNVANGEQCDPAGSTIYDRSQCRLDGTGNATATTCTATCRLGTVTTVSCRDSAKCGNGRIDSGEVCDDGVLNGQWNKCNSQCSGRVAKQPEGPGYCGDAVPQSKFEVCDAGRTARICRDETTCGPQEVCQDVISCQGLCRKNGTLYSACTSDVSCRGYLPNTQQVLQNWYNPATMQPIQYVTFSQSEVQIASLVPSNRNFQLLPARNSVYNYSSPTGGYTYFHCDTSQIPFSCRMAFSFAGATRDNACGGTTTDTEVDLYFGVYPSECDASGCIGHISSNPGSSSVSGSCLTYLQDLPSANNLTIKLKRTDTVSCEIQQNNCSTTRNCRQEDTCTTRQVCEDQPVGVNDPTYGLTKSLSCAWDCQKFGPYCGDGIVQSEFGEECDGNKTCQIDGDNGSRNCSSQCKYQDKTVVSWWKLQTASSSGQEFLDTMSGRNATCSGTACPTLVAAYGPNETVAAQFDGFQDKLTVAHNTSLMPTSSLSVEMWVNPQDYSRTYQRLMEKGGYQGYTMPGAYRSNNASDGGYSLEFNNFMYDSSRHVAAFSVWTRNGRSLTVLSSSTLPLNTWTYVAATYEWRQDRDILSIYINGKLEQTQSFPSPNGPFMQTNNSPLTIGAGATSGDWFKGGIVQAKVANRVLQPAEIKDRFTNTWPCTVPPKTSASLAAGVCGNAVVDAGEACDLGVERNGLQCSASYGQSCQYCSADCKNTQNVRSTEYCGNGKIEGSEIFEQDGAAIYAKNQGTFINTLETKDLVHNGYLVRTCDEQSDELARNGVSIRYKGTKRVSADCRSFSVIENGTGECAVCGFNATPTESATGLATVAGKLMNVLEFPSGAGVRTEFANDPLYSIPSFGESATQITQRGAVSLYFTSSTNPAISPALAGNVYGNRSFTRPPSDGYSIGSYNSGNSIESVKLYTNQLCSNNQGAVYKLRLNGSASLMSDNFNISQNPKPWQYDLILSPVMYGNTNAYIDQDGRAAPGAQAGAQRQSVRVVVSWVGNTEFVTGLFIPTTFTSLQAPASKRNGLLYFTGPFSDPGSYNVWYHGLNTSANDLSVESYTIDTSRMTADTYAVYVAVVGASQSMKNMVNGNSQLRVDVYLPDPQATKMYQFSAPSRTFYIKDADISTQNAAAQYWHVFDIEKGDNNTPMIQKIGKAKSFDALTQETTEYENGRVLSTFTDMR